jgi:hypothetical protein
MPFGVDMGLMPIKAWLMHIWVFGAAALTLPEAAGLYRFRTRSGYCDLRFGRMGWLRQDRDSYLFACSI